GIADPARGARPRLIVQAFQTLLDEPTTPLANTLLCQPRAVRHGLVVQTARTSQDDPGSTCQRRRRTRSARPRLQRLTLLHREHQGSLRTASTHALPPTRGRPYTLLLNM